MDGAQRAAQGGCDAAPTRVRAAAKALPLVFERDSNARSAELTYHFDNSCRLFSLYITEVRANPVVEIRRSNEW